MHAQEIATHLQVRGNASDALLQCIHACHDCAQACADACLGEKSVAELTQCIRLNLDCADLCAVTGMVGSRRTGTNQSVIKRTIGACAEACRICAEECANHAAKHAHCRICADACRQCERACHEAAGTIQASTHQRRGGLTPRS